MKQHSLPVKIKDGKTEYLSKVSLDSREYDEAWVQDICYDNPGILPIAEIEQTFSDMIPICKELGSPSGSMDLHPICKDNEFFFLYHNSSTLCLKSYHSHNYLCKSSSWLSNKSYPPLLRHELIYKIFNNRVKSIIKIGESLIFDNIRNSIERLCDTASNSANRIRVSTDAHAVPNAILIAL